MVKIPSYKKWLLFFLVSALLQSAFNRITQPPEPEIIDPVELEKLLGLPEVELPPGIILVSETTYYERGLSAEKKDDWNTAIDNYTKAIRLNPTKANFYYHRGIAWRSKSNNEKAREDYSEAIRLDPNHALAYHDRGTLWSDLGEYEKAQKDFLLVTELSPQLSQNYNRLSWLLATCPNADFRDGQQAVVLATKACELSNWEDKGYIDTLAAAYAEAGNFQQASLYQERVIEMLDDELDTQGYEERLKLYLNQKPYHRNQ